MRKITKDEICKAISKSLIDFGYPDAKPPMIAEIYDAFKAGKRRAELPHGVIGQFAESQLDEIAEQIDLP